MSAKWHEKPLTLRLTAYQRRVLWGVVDGAIDAGACKDGLTKKESAALHSVSEKLLGIHDRDDEQEPRP